MFEEIHDVKKSSKARCYLFEPDEAKKKTWASKDAYIKIIFHRFL